MNVTGELRQHRGRILLLGPFPFEFVSMLGSYLILALAPQFLPKMSLFVGPEVPTTNCLWVTYKLEVGETMFHFQCKWWTPLLVVGAQEGRQTSPGSPPYVLCLAFYRKCSRVRWSFRFLAPQAVGILFL